MKFCWLSNNFQNQLTYAALNLVEILGKILPKWLRRPSYCMECYSIVGLQNVRSLCFYIPVIFSRVRIETVNDSKHLSSIQITELCSDYLYRWCVKRWFKRLTLLLLYRTLACTLPTWCGVSCDCSLDKGSHSCQRRYKSRSKSLYYYKMKFCGAFRNDFLYE